MDRERSERKLCEIESAYIINKFAADATMCCSKCGSRSSDPATLCSPVRLPSAG